MERSHRLIEGPTEDLLDMDQMAAYLHMSATTLRRLIQLGEFPRPILISDRGKVWDWKDAVFWKLRCELKPRLRKKGEAKTPGAARSAQEPPNPKRPKTAD